jgi:hypothetical protein
MQLIKWAATDVREQQLGFLLHRAPGHVPREYGHHSALLVRADRTLLHRVGHSCLLMRARCVAISRSWRYQRRSRNHRTRARGFHGRIRRRAPPQSGASAMTLPGVSTGARAPIARPFHPWSPPAIEPVERHVHLGATCGLMEAQCLGRRKDAVAAQLADVRRDASRLVAGEQLGRCALLSPQCRSAKPSPKRAFRGNSGDGELGSTAQPLPRSLSP